jgi:hypothetical protein
MEGSKQNVPIGEGNLTDRRKSCAKANKASLHVSWGKNQLTEEVMFLSFTESR